MPSTVVLLLAAGPAIPERLRSACARPRPTFGAPCVLANAGLSFTGIVRAARADAFVISERALALDEYPSVGRVWATVEEREWFDAHCTEIGHHSDKRTFLVEE